LLVTVCIVSVRVKPAAVRTLLAAAAVSPVTFGTFVVVVGGGGWALAMSIVTVEPGVAWVPAAGFWLTTVPGFALDD
jgi:hypothetical protein